MNKIIIILQMLFFSIRYPSETVVFLIKACYVIMDLVSLSIKDDIPKAAEFGVKGISKVGDGEKFLGHMVSLWICKGEGNPIDRAKEIKARLDLSYAKEKMIIECIKTYEADPSPENLSKLIDIKNNYVEPNPDAI